MKKLFILFFVVLCIASCCKTQKPVAFVNPMIGTSAHGHTFPGATAPFGMVQLSPDTRLNTWDGCSGYHYSDNVIYGFSHTHLSGTGCSDYGDILFMPTTGTPFLSNSVDTYNSYPSHFNHKKEKAKAGYYSVILDDYNIKAELTATERVGFHRYTFPKNEGNVILDLNHRDEVITSSLQIISDTEIAGLRRSKAWAKDQYVYFVAHFSQPFSNCIVSSNDSVALDNSIFENMSFEGKKLISCFSFTNLKKPLIISVAISPVSIENARNNLVFDCNFDEALNYTRNLWNTELSKIDVKTINYEDKFVFYTALYHSMIAPNLYTDTDGKYRGRDLQIHQSDNFNVYTVFSLWDTYRSEHPLLSIIDQKRTKDFINTFLKQYEQGGNLPVWELSANETYCMIGYHSIPVIYDAFMKGIRDFDTNLALEAMIHSANNNFLGLPQYKKYGFIPSNEEGESVSKTLEYAYDDWCISMFAKELGKESIYKEYTQRAQSYKNIFDKNTRFHRAKYNNKWFSPFDPKEVNFNYTEANGWQYNFYVPQDINTYIDMVGGDSIFTNMLDNMFTEDTKTTGREQSDITGLIGQYAHGNEPSHNFAYLYNYAGSAWKTQDYVRKIMQTLYSNKPDGLCGNEDCGQMSAWFVLSSLGFFPSCPGDGRLIIGSPFIKKATINLENGKTFTIKTVNQSKENIFIKKITLNGADYPHSYISYNNIFDGGEIIFFMTKTPNKNFASNPDNRPKNIISDNLITPTPFFTCPNITFFDNMSVSIDVCFDNCNIYYTLDGTDPNELSNLYINPIKIDNTTTISAIAMGKELIPSKIIKTTFQKMPKQRHIQLLSNYENQYSGGGDNALIDFIRGGEDFKTGGWQGYYGVDMEAVVDLGYETDISYIAVGCLSNPSSWIFFPTKVVVSFSSDNVTFENEKTLEYAYNESSYSNTIHDFQTILRKQKARYVKVFAQNRKSCPVWHNSAGEKAWIFLDEIIIETK